MNLTSDRRPQLSVRAFSLIELLVAMTVSLILLGLVLGMLSTTLDTWRTTGAYRQQHKAARISFETIESDLQAAIIRPILPSDNMQSVPWLKIESTSFSNGTSTKLSVVSPILDQSSTWKGDVCIVQYALAERATRDGPEVMLFRELREPESIYGETEWGAGFLPDEEVFQPSSAVASNFGIFRIELEVSSEDGSTKIVPSEKEPVVSHDGDVTWTGSTDTNRLLAVHVTAEILSPTGINILFDAGYDAIPEKEKRSFFHRVPLADGRQ